jgi:hypothetical protein
VKCLGLAYKSGRDTKMLMELWGGDLGRHFRMLEDNIRKKSWRVQDRWNKQRIVLLATGTFGSASRTCYEDTINLHY